MHVQGRVRERSKVHTARHRTVLNWSLQMNGFAYIKKINSHAGENRGMINE